VQIEINEPELLSDLCDFLSRHGCIAVAADRERANVLVANADDAFDALRMLKNRLRLWRLTHPGAKVSIDREL
jgi:hypothetical protein